MKLKLEYFMLSIIFLLIGCTSSIDPKQGKISEENLQKLIHQLNSGELYWNAYRKSSNSFQNMWSEKLNYKADAAKLLGRLAENGTNVDAAIPSLIRNLKPQNYQERGEGEIIPVRANSAKALGIIGDPIAIDGLIELIKDSKQCLSTNPTSHCEDFISMPCSNSHCKPLIDENIKEGFIERQKEAIIALRKIKRKKPEVVTLLMSGLKDESPIVSYESAKALANLEVFEAVDLLVGQLEKESDPSTQSKNAKAVGVFGKRANKAVPTLTKIIKRNVKPYEEISALREIGTPEAIKALGTFSKSSNPKVSDTAKDALHDFEQNQKNKSK
jgi:HEAT repeat protein